MTTLHTHTPKLIASTIVVLLAAGMTTSAPQIDNAALLYYQACMLYGQPDGEMEQMLADFRDGKTASNEVIRKHIEANRFVIGYVVKGADLPHCDWGYDYSLGLDITLTHLSTIRRIAFLVAADARLFAEQGDYRTAMDRCVTLHKMARHETDRMLVTYLVGVAMSGLANRTIQDLLVGVSGEPESLSQLNVQLSRFQDAFPSVATAIAQESQLWAASMRKEQAESFLRTLKDGDDPTKSESVAALIRDADDSFFERSRTHWLNSIAAMIDILKSGLPYAEICARLDALDTRLAGEAPDNPDAILTALSLPATERVYMLATRLQTHFNALRTAIDIYAVRARTGRSPDSLPPNSPLDPFSGGPFVYEKANDHFILRCQAKEYPEKTEANQYQFKIRP